MIIYSLGIFVFDYFFYSSFNYSFGIQGRYFFPTVVAQMALLMIGFVSLVAKRFERFKSLVIKILTMAMVSLNSIALWIIVKTCYDLSSLGQLINEVSQYKPFYFKGPFIYIWFTFYVASLISILVIYFRSERIRA